MAGQAQLDRGRLTGLVEVVVDVDVQEVAVLALVGEHVLVGLGQLVVAAHAQGPQGVEGLGLVVDLGHRVQRAQLSHGGRQLLVTSVQTRRPRGGTLVVGVAASRQVGQLGDAVDDEDLDAGASHLHQAGGHLRAQRLLVDDESLVAGPLGLDGALAEPHLGAQQVGAVKELVGPPGVLHAQVRPPRVLARPHPMAAVELLVRHAPALGVKEDHAGAVVREVVGAQDTDVDARAALTQQVLHAADRLGPQRVELGRGLAGVEALGEEGEHALVARPVGGALGPARRGPAVQDCLGDAGGELGIDDLVVEAVVEHVVACGGTGLGGVLLAQQVRGAGHEAVGVDLGAELQGLVLDAVYRDAGAGQLEGQAVGDLRAQRDAVGVEELLEGQQHVLDVEVGERLDVVVADLGHRHRVRGVERLEGVDGGHRHERGPADQHREPGDDVVAAAGGELIGHGPPPEHACLTGQVELQGVHVHLGAGVARDDLLELVGEHHLAPVVDDGVHAVALEVVDRVVDRGRGLGDLAGAVLPEDEQAPAARVWCAPGQLTLLARAGDQVRQVRQRGDVDARRTVLRRGDDGGDHGHEALTCAGDALEDDVRAVVGGRQVCGGQRSAASACHVLVDEPELLGRGVVVGGDGGQVGIGPVGAGGEGEGHTPLGGLARDGDRVVGPLLAAPPIAGVIDAILGHGQELHAAKAQAVGLLDLVADRGVGVQALGEPPPLLGAVLDAG
ncbi:MAG: hypothetical protein Q605_AUC00814G0001, partial [Actinomyces urogenitalis DORA_12]